MLQIKLSLKSGSRVKTDRIDSKKLAILLSGGLLKSIVVPSPEERYIKPYYVVVINLSAIVYGSNFASKLSYDTTIFPSLRFRGDGQKHLLRTFTNYTFRTGGWQRASGVCWKRTII